MRNSQIKIWKTIGLTSDLRRNLPDVNSPFDKTFKRLKKCFYAIWRLSYAIEITADFSLKLRTETTQKMKTCI